MVTAVKNRNFADLYAVDFEVPTKAGAREINLNETSWKIGFTGVTGGGKTLSMTYFAAQEMINNDRVVFSNYPISFKALSPYGEIKEYKSLPLDTVELYQFKDTLNNSLVLIDEIEVYFDARSSMSTKNRIFTYLIIMMRKLDLSLFWTAQADNEVDPRIRSKTDVYIECQDAHYKYPTKYKRGKMIFLDVYDNSGKFTGKKYDPYMNNQPCKTLKISDADRVWPIYNTRETIDVFEAGRGLDIDMAKIKITDKPQMAEWGNKIDAVVDFYSRSNMDKVPTDEFWNNLGVTDAGMRKEIGKLLKQKGIRAKKNYKGDYFYYLNAQGNEE